MTSAPHPLALAYTDAFNRADLDALDRLLAPDYTNHSPGWDDITTDRDGVKQVVARLHDTFEDLQYTVQDVIATSDGFAMRLRMTGRDVASGRPIDVAVMQFERLRNGQITDHWRITDEAEMARQLS
jgi:ketosteroid isomerase-like protein